MTDPSSKKGKKNCFEIGTPGVKRVFYLFADSESEKNEWVKAIRDTVEKKKAGVDFDKKEVRPACRARTDAICCSCSFDSRNVFSLCVAK